MGLSWRPITRADIGDLSDLLTAIERRDDPGDRHSVANLSENLDDSGADTGNNTVVGRDAGGTAVAYAWNHPINSDTSPRRIYLAGGVHPAWRRRGIGRAVLGWQLEQGRRWYQATRQPGFGPLQLTAYVNDKLTQHRRLYERAGMQALRWYADMRIELDSPPTTVVHPDGVLIVPFTAAHCEGVRQAHNEAFADVWGSQPVDAASWHQQLVRPSSRPQWSWVALDAATGKVIGYTLNSCYEQQWGDSDSTEGWTDRIGVRPAWRGRRIARALLLASMRSFADAGMTVAGLGVDSDRPSAAFALYEAFGYHTMDTVVMYGKTEDHSEPG